MDFNSMNQADWYADFFQFLPGAPRFAHFPNHTLNEFCVALSYRRI